MNKLFEMKDYTDQYEQEDANKHRAFGILSYIGILFLIGLFAAKDSKWTRFHTNQGLVLCILDAALVIMNYTLGPDPVRRHRFQDPVLGRRSHRGRSCRHRYRQYREGQSEESACHRNHPHSQERRPGKPGRSFLEMIKVCRRPSLFRRDNRYTERGRTSSPALSSAERRRDRGSRTARCATGSTC